MSAQPLTPFVFKPGRIGDMIMLTAALRRLHSRYGRPCCVVGAESWLGDLFAGSEDVVRWWSFPRKVPFFFGAAWLDLLRALRASAPGPVYVFEHHPRQLPRIRRLLALSRIDLRRCVFIDEQPGTDALWLDRLLQFAERTPAALREADYALPASAEPLAPRLWVLDRERKERDAWLRRRGWRGEALILIQPGNHRTMGRRRLRQWCDRDDKTWPVDRWVRLLQRVHERMPEAMIVLRGAPAELPLLEAIRAAAGLRRVTSAGTALRPLFALCEVAHSMISADTGPAHAAAALGLPLVVLYGIQPPRVWLPRSPSGSPVIPLGGPPEYERVEQISVEAVFQAWCSLTREPPRHDDSPSFGQAAAQPGRERSPAPSIQTTSVTIEPSALSSRVR